MAGVAWEPEDEDVVRRALAALPIGAAPKFLKNAAEHHTGGPAVRKAKAKAKAKAKGKAKAEAKGKAKGHGQGKAKLQSQPVKKGIVKGASGVSGRSAGEDEEPPEDAGDAMELGEEEGEEQEDPMKGEPAVISASEAMRARKNLASQAYHRAVLASLRSMQVAKASASEEQWELAKQAGREASRLAVAAL